MVPQGVQAPNVPLLPAAKCKMTGSKATYCHWQPLSTVWVYACIRANETNLYLTRDINGVIPLAMRCHVQGVF